MNLLSKPIRLLLLLTLAFSSVAQAQTVKTPIWQGKGRIVISSDGNEHDWDDWAASAMTLAILASHNMQDDLALYTYSDHVWGSNQERSNIKGMCAYNHMRESVLKGAEYFGFEGDRFICAVDNAEVAYNAMRDEINKSSADYPLFIIGAGPMQVIGEGMNRADRDKLKYVTVVSHSGWNNIHSDKPQANFAWDMHSGWTFAEMIESFGEETFGAKFIQIKDQNHGWGKYTALQCERSNFDWLLKSKARGAKLYPKGSWKWLYTRLESCAVKNDTVFDVSDAGMLMYLLTGDEQVSPSMIQNMMENPRAPIVSTKSKK